MNDSLIWNCDIDRRRNALLLLYFLGFSGSICSNMAEAVVQPINGALEIGQMVCCDIKINGKTKCQVKYPKGVDGKRDMLIHRFSIHKR